MFVELNQTLIQQTNSLEGAALCSRPCSLQFSDYSAPRNCWECERMKSILTNHWAQVLVKQSITERTINNAQPLNNEC